MKQACGMCLLLLMLVIAPLTAQAQAPIERSYWPTDDWRTASPESREMDPGLLGQADLMVPSRVPLLSALLVVRGGRIVFERYYNGLDRDEPLLVWSVTKSVTNMAIGIALREGLFSGLDETLGEIMPDRIPAAADPRVAAITLEDLLTMTAGWSWDGRINFARSAETDDLDLMLARPLVCDPGLCFEYDSGSSNLLSYAIQVRAREPMADYLQSRLFDPMGIERPEWIATDDDATRGGGGLFLTPREMAKVGYLYLNRGVWDGEQIVDSAWVETSTRAHSSGVSAVTGVNIVGGAYGYHWWITEAGGLPAYMAVGYGGQLVYVVPEVDLIVVTAVASADATRPDLQQAVRPFVEQFIIPAAQ
jgi:CubicO group peptidase (beta-lactamase class C family)